MMLTSLLALALSCTLSTNSDINRYQLAQQVDLGYNVLSDNTNYNVSKFYVDEYYYPNDDNYAQFLLNLNFDNTLNENIYFALDFTGFNTSNRTANFDVLFQTNITNNYNVDCFLTAVFYDNGGNGVLIYKSPSFVLGSRNNGYGYYFEDTITYVDDDEFIGGVEDNLAVFLYMQLTDTNYQTSVDDGSYADGYTTGYNEGYDSGTNVGYNNGYTDGFNDGKTNGYNTGYTQGYNTGMNTALSTHSFSFTNLFASISDTPILMIRRLFGFEIFGTSVMAIFMSLFTALIVIKVIKKVF